MIDYQYRDEIVAVTDVFESPSGKKHTMSELEINYFYAQNDEEPDMFYAVLAVSAYEARKNALTEKMKKQFLDYADRFDKGEFQPDMIPEDIPIVAKDIEFVRSKINT